MIRVLMVHWEFAPQSSGVARHMDGLAAALVRRGDVAPTVLSPRLGRVEARGYEVVDGGLAALPAQLRRCDLVHVHSSRTVLSAVALRLARLMGKPAVFTPHCYYQGGGRLRRAGKWGWDRLVERGSLRRADAVILLHGGWQAIMAQLGLYPRHAVVIPNCIDSDAVLTRLAAASPHRLSGQPALLSVGRLDKVKRLDDAIAALAQPGLEQAHLHIVGQGPDAERLRTLTAALNLDGRVHFLGWRDDDATAALMQGCDAMVLASEREGLPTVLLEALQGQVPVAISDIDGNRAVADAVGWGGDAVFPLGDLPALAASLRHCAGTPVPATVAESVRRQFSWQSRADDVAALYHRLLATVDGPA